MWDQAALFTQPRSPLTVSEVTSRIRSLLEQEATLQDIWIEGEVSNLTRASSGHVYLTLKDAGAQIGAVIWRNGVRSLTYQPQSGDKIQAHGRVGVYERGGRYQFYIDQVRPAGQGSLYQEYERLRAQLKAEGLFDEERKRPLPSFPTTIGVVTSPNAAALRDVLNVLSRRCPMVRVLLSPTLVQGDAAPPRIVAALARLNARDDVDVLLLVRGGGSLEDLWAFNDEGVARAVAASRLPIISGVGHETDFSLADFAADVRAPTPSAAAELVVPDLTDLGVALAEREQRMGRAVLMHLARQEELVATHRRALDHLSPLTRVEGGRQRVDDLGARLQTAALHRLEMSRQRAGALAARLAALGPQAVLQRGYAIVRGRPSGRVIASASATTPGQRVSLQFSDGEVAARVDDQ